MKTFKKTMAVAAAIGLTTAGAMTSYASATTLAPAASETATQESKKVNDKGGVDSKIEGRISITQISVVVPTATCFDIDPNEAATPGAPTAQMVGQAQNYTIENVSTVPLDISITKVAVATTAGGTAASLIDKTESLATTEHSVMFAIRKTGNIVPKLPNATSIDATNDKKWMTVAGVTTDTPYYVTDNQADSTLQAGDTLPMTIYAATKKGWASGNKFTVTPTFTVSLHTS